MFSINIARFAARQYAHCAPINASSFLCKLHFGSKIVQRYVWKSPHCWNMCVKEMINWSVYPFYIKQIDRTIDKRLSYQVLEDIPSFGGVFFSWARVYPVKMLNQGRFSVENLWGNSPKPQSRQSTRLFFSRPNWYPPPPQPQASVPPTPLIPGGNTLLGERGWGVPVRTRGQTLWYSTWSRLALKVHKRENFLGSDIEICSFSQLVMHKC